MKTVYLLRHAQTVPGGPHLADHDRTLTAAGSTAARQTGAALRARNALPQQILCSTAQRAVETCARLQEGADAALKVEYLEKLYLAAPEEIAQQLSPLPEALHSVMVIGHNPGLHQLCLHWLARGEVDDAQGDAAESLTLKFAPGALAAFDFSDHWTHTGNSHPQLKLFLPG